MKVLMRFLLLVVVFCLVSCDFDLLGYPAELRVTNKSSRSIALYLGVDSVIPQTDAPVKKGIDSGEECVLYGYEDKAEGLLQEMGHESFTILVFDIDTLDSYTWKEIIEGRKVWQVIKLPDKTVRNCGTYINIWD